MREIYRRKESGDVLSTKMEIVHPSVPKLYAATYDVITLYPVSKHI